MNGNIFYIKRDHVYFQKINKNPELSFRSNNFPMSITNDKVAHSDFDSIDCELMLTLKTHWIFFLRETE